MRFHVPSLCVGVVLSLGLAVFLAADRPYEEPAARFDIEATASYVFVIDRETGRVWQKYVATSSGQTDPDFSQPKKR